MGEQYITSEEKLEFRQIILQHLQRILKIASLITPRARSRDKVKGYAFSVQALADCLVPFYNDEMDKCYEKYKKEVKELNKRTCEGNHIKDEPAYILGWRRIHRQLFRDLNVLMKSVDYLKKAIYVEGDKSE